jgi:hypothetical protein
MTPTPLLYLVEMNGNVGIDTISPSNTLIFMIFSKVSFLVFDKLLYQNSYHFLPLDTRQI